MSASSGPKLELNGAVFSIDPANRKSNLRTQYNTNLINYSTWNVGTGSIGIFSMNGTSAENTRLYDTDPFNQSAVVWETPSNDVTSDADGGWDSSRIPINPTKMYRFSVWVRRKVIGNGSFYLGCYGFNAAGTNEGVLGRSNGLADTNPYFTATAWWGNANQWYLVVGHVWPAGSGTGSTHLDSGIYTTTGVKVATVNDFVWQATNVNTTHRTYLYYSTDTTTRQQWWQPRIDLCDGKEVPLSSLLQNATNTMVNVLNPTVTVTLKNQIAVTANNTLAFNNDTNYINLPAALGYTTAVSVFAWVKTAGAPKGGYHIVCGPTDLEISIPTTGELRTGVNTSNGRFVQNDGSGLTDGKWHYIGFTFDGATKIGYIDGAAVGTPQAVTGTLVTSVPSRAIGTFGAGDVTYAMNGEISSYRVFNTALTAAQVKTNFNALRGRFGI